MSTSSLQGPGQSYQIQDIYTPYGPLNIAAIPLPAEVVQSMSVSITDVQSQTKPKMTLISSQTSFSTGITEGDPRKSVCSVQIRNDGGFGSFLSAYATPDVPWLSVLTPEITGVERGETASFGIDLVPDNMLALQSPFVGHVTIQDVSDLASSVTVTVTVVVNPRPKIGVSTQHVSMTWSISEQTTSSQHVVISNDGPGTSSLNFSIMKVLGVPWLTVSPDFGGPLASGETKTIILSVLGSSMPVSLGDHTETIRVFSPNASNSPVDIVVTLTVDM